MKKRKKQPENGRKFQKETSDTSRDTSRDTRELVSRQSSCTCNCEDLFPSWFPWCVVIATVVVRVCYVYQPESWWILHPDEVFQSVEIAFSEVYGHGFYPYEYLPPPTNLSTDGEKQQAAMEMYSLRSFLYPQMFAVAMKAARWFNLTLSPFMVCRISNVIVTSTLPLAVYFFVRKLFRCHLVSCLACALTASCMTLTVFGTHCIINSFTAPFVFFGLVLCLPSHLNSSDKSETKPGQRNATDINGNVSRKSQRNQTTLTSHLANGDVSGGVGRKNDYDSIKSLPDFDEHEHDQRFEKNEKPKQERLNKFYCYNGIRKNKEGFKGREDCSRHFTLSLYFHVQLWESKINWACVQYFFAGSFIGALCYIRVELALFFSVIYLSVLLTEIKVLINNSCLQDLRNELLWLISGGIFVLCICVGYDCCKYNAYILPPLQWIKFNLLSNNSAILFGTGDPKLYSMISLNNRYYGLLVISLFIYNFFLGEKRSLVFKRSAAICISLLFLFIFYLSVSHSEARFFHNIIVLYFIVVSCGLHVSIEVLSKYKVTKATVPAGLAVFLLSFCLNSYLQFPRPSDDSTKHWTYGNATTSKDVNMCLDFISKANDVRGVMLDASIYETHGFSILRHDVPVLTKIHNEYHLYTTDNGGKILSNRKIRILNRYSDYVSIHNPHYLSRLLGRTDTFNYVITKRVMFFTGMKYYEVFKSGSYIVFHRNLTNDQEKQLNKMADELPLGNNATVLEYETGWLITSGLYELAAARAKRSLELDHSRVRVFHQLMVAYGKVDKWTEVEKYQNLCFKHHGQETCETKQEKVVLHDEYRQFET